MIPNRKNTSTTRNDVQPHLDNYHSQFVSLVKISRVHVCQAKLLIRRARAASMGPDYSACLVRLLQGLGRVDSSLELLTNSGDPAEIGSTLSTVVDRIAAGGGIQ